MTTQNNHPTPSSFDPSALQDLSGGNSDFIKEMVSIFIEDAPQAMDGMNLALKESNYKVIGDLAHKIKSSLGVMGLSELHNIAERIETDSTAENHSNLKGMVSTLTSGVTISCKDLKKYTDGL